MEEFLPQLLPGPSGYPRPLRFEDMSLRHFQFPVLIGFHPHSESCGESVGEGMETFGFLLVRSVLTMLIKFIRMNWVGHSSSFFSQSRWTCYRHKGSGVLLKRMTRQSPFLGHSKGTSCDRLLHYLNRSFDPVDQQTLQSFDRSDSNSAFKRFNLFPAS